MDEITRREKFLRRLAQGPLLADGAMGTMLYAHGATFDRSLDDLNRTHPEWVAEVHRRYLEAGADLIETNTFGANRIRLERNELGEATIAINQAGVELARRVAAAYFRPVWIAASVGPTGQKIIPLGRLRPEEAYQIFSEQIRALAEAGAEVLILETFSDLKELEAALQAARAVCDLPVVASATFLEDGLTPLGHTPRQVAELLVAAGADVIGANCSTGPEGVLRAIQEMREVVKDGPPYLSAMPNAGWPSRLEGRLVYPATPEYFGSYTVAFAELGVRLIGGCCGTTPEHIAAMRRALDQPGDIPRLFVPSATPGDTESPATPVGPTPLARQFAAGEFVVSVELVPPKGPNVARLVEAARMLREAGAHVVNVSDNPMARLRMAPWAVCHLVQREVGLDAVLHFPLRGRNLLRLQSDLLAAHALGIRNLFVVMGDPVAIGDYPETHDFYDLNLPGFITLIKQKLNQGLDYAGAKMGQPTGFFIGVATNPAAEDLTYAVTNLHEKLEAGADFAITQPVYDVQVITRFLAVYRERYGELPAPLMVGLLPLYSARHAEFLHNEVPGIIVPEEARARMHAAGEAAATEGVQMAQELLLQLRALPGVRGVYFTPAFGRYDLVAEVAEVLRRRE